MKQIQAIPLAERLQRMKDGQPAYPEYIPSTIQTLAEMPVADYLAGLDAEQQQRFFDLIGCPGGSGYTYQWAASMIQCLRETSPKAANEATRILAEPMARYYEHYKNRR